MKREEEEGRKGTRDADVFIVSARSTHLKCSCTHLTTATDHWHTVRTATYDSARPHPTTHGSNDANVS